MAFKFSLQPALEARRRVEEAAQRELAKSLNKVNLIEQRIAALGEQLVRSASERDKMFSHAYDPRRMDAFACFDLDIQARVGEATKEKGEAQREAQERRGRLLNAVRERRVMDELRKTEWQDYLRKEREAERKQNDEIAMFAFHRRRAEEFAVLQEA